MDTIAALFGRMDERLAKQDDILAQIAQSQTRQNEILAKMDERLAQQQTLLTHLVSLTDIATQEATATHQAMAVALTRYAETRLDVDRFIATAERVLASWEKRQL